MGLFDNPIYNITGLDHPGSPLSTLNNLQSARAPGSAAAPTVSTPSTSIDLPDFTPPDTGSALNAGSQRAESSLKSGSGSNQQASNPSSNGLLGFNPKILDLARTLSGQGGDADRSNAIANAGIGMAAAAGHTGNFLTALAAGAQQGMSSYQQMQAERAERALKENQQNNQNAYQSASLAQTGQYQQGALGIEQQKADLQKQQLAQTGALQPSEIALRQAQARQALAGASAEGARAGLYGAQATALTGGGTGIPQAIWKDAMTQASKEIAGQPWQTPEQAAAALQQRATAISKVTMQARNMDTSNIAAFNPPPAANPGGSTAPPPAAKPPWIGGSFGVPEETAGQASPLLANPVVMVPGNHLAELAQRGSLGAIDLGATRNQAEQSLLGLKNDFQNMAKTSGRAVKDQMETIDQMMPKQGVFVSAPENYDKLTKMFTDTRDNYLADVRMAADPSVPKAQRDIAAKSAPLEARVLYRISGTQPDTSQYPRFQGPGGASAPIGPKVGTVEGGFKFNGGNAGDPKSWSAVSP